MKARYYSWLVIIIGLIIPFRPKFGNALVKVNVLDSPAVPVIRLGNGTSVPAVVPAGIAVPSACLLYTSQRTSEFMICFSELLVEAYVNKEFTETDHEFRGPLTMYEKCGFSRYGEREGRVVMRKALK